MSLLHLFEWFEASSLSNGIRNSVWIFPAIEAVHLLALALLGGTVIVVDMRLFDFGLRDAPLATVARAIEPWLVGSLIVMVSTGLLLALSEPIKLYYNLPFWIKMAFLAPAIVYTFTIRRRVVAAEETGVIWKRLVAIVSIALWSGVGISGRWIGFY